MSAPTTTAVPTGTWNVDPAHSSVEFAVKHLGIANVRGRFTRFEGTLELGEAPTTAKAYGKVYVDSVDTNEEQRDAHLRSPEFFDADRYPELTFESTRVEPLDEDTFKVHGNLTLHGITQDITLEAEVEGIEQDPWGNERVGLEVHGQLRRDDYGMKFNQALGSGNVLVGERVKIELEISAVKQA